MLSSFRTQVKQTNKQTIITVPSQFLLTSSHLEQPLDTVWQLVVVYFVHQ